MKEHRWFYEVARRPLAAFAHFAARLEVKGLENVPAKGPVILVANHLAWMDILAISILCPRQEHFMAKIELFHVPVLGGIFRLLGAFPVRRGEGDRESLRIAQEILEAGQVLVIFPEGHRSDNHALIQGHSGVALIALRSGAPIVPVGISGTERLLKGLRYGPFAPRARVVYGEPFTLPSDGGRRTRDDVVRGIDTIMRRIAALLPPEYRGVYADPGDAPAPTPLPVAALQDAETLDVDASDPSAVGQSLPRHPDEGDAGAPSASA
jgi:1-acyl-sn-glycerol-3-phosphate acyltransferase